MTKVLIHISINRWVKRVSINWWAERVLNYGLVEKVPTRIPLYGFPWMGWWKENSWLEKFSLNSRENRVTTHVSHRISTLSMAHRHPLNEKVFLAFTKWRNLILILWLCIANIINSFWEMYIFLININSGQFSPTVWMSRNSRHQICNWSFMCTIALITCTS